MFLYYYQSKFGSGQENCLHQEILIKLLVPYEYQF